MSETASKQRWTSVKNYEPRRPWQNGFVESFHGCLRDEGLNREQPWTLTEARIIVEDYRREYNQRRPHSQLGYQSPRGSRRKLSPSPAEKRRSPTGTGNGQNQNNRLT